MSGQGTNVYFSDGITEEVLNVLAQVPGLRVAARTSSFAFRDKDVPIDSIARALNVSHVLEGSVRSQGNRVRITAQLIEATSGFHIWSETYDRDLDDIFVVQDEIAAAIAKKLQIELAGNFWGISARETDDPEAYRLLLRALHVFRTPSPESYASSANLLGEALQRDPGYARAYGALANVLLWQATFGWTPAQAAYARADSLARRGLEIAETPESHLALARLAEVLAWNPDSADAHFLRALEINPSDARTLQYRALFLARSSRGDEAIAAARRATELDPLHPGSWSNYATVLSMLGREDEALLAMEKARSIAPNDLIVLTNLANQYANVGRVEDALATSERALQVDSTNLNLLGLRVHLLFAAGRTDQAARQLEALEKRPEFPRFRLASLYANTQNIERVLDLLEESAARKEDELSRIRAPDMFRGLRHHPRFVALLDALGSGAS
jgi:TolB-like protein/Tfp pilus assembly protein PilF